MSDDLVPAATPQPVDPGKAPGRKQLAPDTAPRPEAGGSRAGAAAQRPQSEEDRWRERDEKLDQALKGTFPASDPFSIR
ncbi:MAG TPA: hypothetical protein VFG91_12685 [Woeseiaceae bacterium]|nr:hypothetical protein [Woeseiaceae bacterium]